MGPGLELRKRKGENQIYLDCLNPDCEEEMNITEIKVGTHIKCRKCGNVAGRPPYNLPWHAKTSKFILSIISSVLVTFIVTWMIRKLQS